MTTVSYSNSLLDNDPLLAQLLTEALTPINAERPRHHKTDSTSTTAAQAAPTMSTTASSVLDTLLGHRSQPVQQVERTLSVSLDVLRARVEYLTGRSSMLLNAHPVTAKTHQWRTLVQRVDGAVGDRLGNGERHHSSDRYMDDDDDEFMEIEVSTESLEAIAAWGRPTTTDGDGKHQRRRRFGQAPRDATTSVQNGGVSSPAASPLRYHQHHASPRTQRLSSATAVDASAASPTGAATNATATTAHHNASTDLVATSLSSSGGAPQPPRSTTIGGVQVPLDKDGCIAKEDVRVALAELGYGAGVLDDETFGILFRDVDVSGNGSLTTDEFSLLLSSFGEDVS